MLTLEQLNQLQIFGLSERASADRFYRHLKRMVTDGEWCIIPSNEEIFREVGEYHETWSVIEHLGNRKWTYAKWSWKANTWVRE